MTDSLNQSLVPIAEFPEHVDITPLLNWCSERGVKYTLETHEDKRRLYVDASKAQQCIQFLQALRHQQQVPESAKLKFDLASVFHTWPVTAVLVILGILGALLVSFGGALMYHLTFLKVLVHPWHQPMILSFEDTYLNGHEWWRLLTPIFLHFGAVHIIFNGIAMWDLGRRLETHLGWVKFLVLCLLSGVASNTIQFVFAGSTTFGGLSGVVLAILGGIAVCSWRSQAPVLRLPKGLYVFAGVWIAVGFTPLLEMVFGVSMANAAHVGGFVSGVVIALFMCLTQLGTPHDRQ